MLFDLNRYPLQAFGKEARKLVALAIPLMLSSVASVGMSVVDTAMAGRYGTDDLTAVALGGAVFTTVFVAFLGILTAISPMIAQQFGAGKTQEIGETGRQGLWFGAMLGVLGMAVLVALVAPLRDYLSLSPEVEDKFADYLMFIALGMPAVMLMSVLRAYTSALNRPKPVMWISWGGLLLNIPLNALLMYGMFGLPEWGGAGCGLASALVYWIQLAVLGVYVGKTAYFRRFGLSERFSAPDWQVQRQIWRLGWPIGCSYFLEISLFTSIVWLVADLGADFVAAQQILGNINGVLYMIPNSLGAAATVVVGQALGRRQFARARYASGVALTLGLGGAVFALSVLVFGRYALVGLYTDYAPVVGIAVSIALLAGVMQLFDFLQTIASYALRGYKITRAPMYIHALCFWGLGLLPGYVLAYHAGWSIYGFWAGIILSVVVAALLLVWYLERCSAWAVRHRGI